MTEVMEALKDDEIDIIGICGMGGVGKTTMVKEVATKAKADHLFDEIVMSVVSQDRDLKKIQGEIGDMLGLKFDEDNIIARAGRLCARLKNGKRILVILDDVWEGFDLGEVGIPLGGDRKGCKVVLTSRLQRVCSDMGTQKDFTVQVLSEQEAWDLFKEIAGNSVDSSTDIHPIAKEVVKECGGLPIAVITVAKALKNRRKHAWNDALQQLRRSNVTHIPGMHDNVNACIELSYSHLESHQAKSLLLLCCIFPEDYEIPIEDLVRYGVGRRLFEDVETLADARDRVYWLVDELRSCYLLLAGDEDKEFVKLHDVVRDVGISIASKGEHLYMVRHDTQLKEWPQKETYQHYTAISLSSNKMQELPAGGLDCPKLKLLRLVCDLSSENISGDFFEGMKELSVVGLEHMSLHTLPPSFQSLENLRTLCLHSCHFTTDLSIIGSLTKLEILSFFNCYLENEFPSEIGKLSNLKLLDLRSEYIKGKIPAGVLFKLSKLEELYMGLVRLKAEEIKAIITELNSLSNLKTLEIEIDAELLRGDFCFEKLMRFHISIGSRAYGYFPKYQFQNSLRLGGLDISVLLETGINVLLTRTKILTLEVVKGLKNVVNELDVKCFVELKELWLYNCAEVEYLIDATDLVLDSAFVSLESLKLQCMDNLKEICRGNLPAAGSIQPAECLGNLRVLDIRTCNAMRSLFTPSIVKGLVQLQKLKISSCDVMEEIVAKEGEGDEIEFPKLNLLRLEGLPNLRSFYPIENNHDDAIQPLFNQKIRRRARI
uniref:Uncharacterized protein n=1 Tax=Davidia involucrata TaxID=16924 RepID=A0A5B6Z6W5_DAVIN